MFRGIWALPPIVAPSNSSSHEAEAKRVKRWTSFPASLEASALVYDMARITVAAHAQSSDGLTVISAHGVSMYSQVLLPRHHAGQSPDVVAMRQTIAHQKFEAARQRVDRQASALRDAAMADLQDYHPTIVRREQYQQLGGARNKWEEQHVAIVQFYHGEADNLRYELNGAQRTAMYFAP